MSHDIVESDPGDTAPQPGGDDVRSGSGADTAMQAMLKKRLMHANDGAEDIESPRSGEGN